MVTRYWKITTYTPFYGEETTYYYSGHSDDKMLKFADDCVYENASEWYDMECGLDEESYYEGCGCRIDEINYETFRNECGY